MPNPIPTVEIYETDYGRIIMGDDLVALFKKCAREEMRIHPFDETETPRRVLAEPELEAALTTIMRKAAEVGIGTIRL
jgi:hypothetical protein